MSAPPPPILRTVPHRREPLAQAMSPERVQFAVIIVLALTLNVSFSVGDMTDPTHHHAVELFLAIVVSLVATVMKFGDRSPLGSTMLATSIVADLHLLAAAGVWGWAVRDGATIGAVDAVGIVSLSIGAVIANILSVVLLVIEVASLKR